MKHPNSARKLAPRRGAVSRILSVLVFVGLIFSTHSGAATGSQESTFVDSTAIVQCGGLNKSCTFGSGVYIGPFAILRAGQGSGNKKTAAITIGNDSNVQDNTILDTTTNGSSITLGEKVIIAHGAAVYGGARIGVTGTCRPDILICAAFVGFNSEVAENAVVERDAMVTHLAKVGPHVTIPSGRVVMPGKEVRTQSEVMEKTEEITPADRQFMADVIRVNLALAAGYTALDRQLPTSVCGINVNPETPFTPNSVPPSFDGHPLREPTFPNRIIGNIEFTQARPPVGGNNISLRADEGTPFTVGTIASLRDYATFHALEHTELRLGEHGSYGAGSLMHGGKDHKKITSTGINFVLGDNAVFYNSTAGSNCHIGAMSFVANASLLDNTSIPANYVLLGDKRSRVEWERRARPVITDRGRCPR